LKYLVAGLGNPGEEYAHTRHNIGFDVVEHIASKAEIAFTPGRYAHVALVKIRGRQVFLIKPTTFMNLSGKAVNYWLQAEKIPLENLIIVTDDIALPVGTLRIRAKGSDGGHNGLKDISETLGTTDFARLRFGIGNDFPRGSQADYVLDAWPETEKKLVQEKIAVASEAVRTFVAAGIVLTMNQFNNK